MSKFVVKMQFEINQDELGTILGTLTSSYRGTVESINAVENKVINTAVSRQKEPENKHFKEPARPIYTTPKKSVSTTRKSRKKEPYDTLPFNQLTKLLEKHARIGNAHTAEGWLNFLNDKGNSQFNKNAVSGHIGRLMLLGIFKRELLKENEYSDYYLYRIMRLPTNSELRIKSNKRPSLNGYYA